MRRSLLFAFSLLFLACSATPEPEPEPIDPGPYPPHWWQSVPTEGAPEWEILPQAARPPKVILSKRNELGILSNFADTPFTYRGKRYASLEGYWQCMKYPESEDDPRISPKVKWGHTRAEVAAMVAFEAHSAGVAAEKNMATLGIDWVSFEGERIAFKGEGVERHYELIVDATWAKVRQNRRVREVLRATGDLELLPDHHEDADGTKAWRYYAIYMAIREKLSELDWKLPPGEGAPKESARVQNDEFDSIHSDDLVERIAAKAEINVIVSRSLARTLSAEEWKAVRDQPSWKRALSKLSEVLGGTLDLAGNVYTIKPR